MANGKLVEAVSELAQKSCEPMIVDHGEKTGQIVYFLQGKFHVHQDRPHYRQHQAYSLDTITDFANRFLGRAVSDDPNEVNPAGFDAAVWYNRDAVSVLLNDEDRRERVVFNLALSPQIKSLQKSGDAIKQRALILWLRTTMANCLPVHPTFIDSVRTLKFRTNQEATGEFKKDRASLGKSIISELTASEELPEYVTFNVPVFDNGSLSNVRANVQCAIDIVPADENFFVIPIAGSIEKAITDGEEQILTKLQEGFGGRIYYGKP